MKVMVLLNVVLLVLRMFFVFDFCCFYVYFFCFSSIPGTFSSSNVGAPLPCAEIKLVGVPKLNYLVSDYPNPRGEIYVRGPIVCQGYLNLPEETYDNFLCSQVNFLLIYLK